MSPAAAVPPKKSSPLHVSRYDRVASLLIALLIIFGMVVFFLLITWLTSTLFVSPVAVPVELAEVGEGEGPMGGGPELEEPMEVPELPQEEIEESIAAVAEVVVSNIDQLVDPDLMQSLRRGGGGSGRGFGPGTGGGVRRRWEVRFPKGNTLEKYARQLDYFGIELGVLLPKNRVVYVRKLSQSRPEVRRGPADAEKRYYLTWRRGGLQQADRELLAKAGVDATGKLILKFLPPQVEARLVELEKIQAGSKADRIQKTVFGIKEANNKYTFYVIDQVLQW